jgi:hypothetical protein
MPAQLMASTNTRTKHIYYKRAVFSQSTGKTLEEILRIAILAKSQWGERRENSSGDEQTFCFVNHSSRYTHTRHQTALLGGELFSYVKGSDQSIFDVDPTAAEVNVSSIPPGKDREFLEGALYFGVSGDHLAVMQSASLRFGDLERHLNWLLTRCARVIPEENGVTLMDAVPQVRDRTFNDVKAIKLLAPLHFEAQVASSTARRRVQTARLVPTGRAWEALKAMLGAGFDLPNYLDAEEILSSRSLQVEIQLKWKRAPDEGSTDLLTQIAHNLRNVSDEVDYSIDTRMGRLNREDFKLHAPVSVPWISGRPRLDVLFPKMIEYLVSLVEADKIKL